MAKPGPVVCFGCYDYWNSNPGSPIQIMDAMHQRGHKVLWINSIGMNMPRLRKRGLLKRVGLKLRSWARWLRPHRQGFWVLAPIVLPLFGNRHIEKWNDRWLWLQIRLTYLLLGLRRPLAFVCMPTFAEVAAKLPREGLIYYYTDKYDAYRYISARESIQGRASGYRKHPLPAHRLLRLADRLQRSGDDTLRRGQRSVAALRIDRTRVW